jgi:rRNA-processing protein FCF1
MTEIQALFAKYRNKGILIDTNIFLLYLVGSVNRERISKFKRTMQFEAEDYDILLQIVSNFTEVITTPNILTEVNSLANQLGEPERSKCCQLFAILITQVREEYLNSNDVAQQVFFAKFGLTDSGIMQLAKDKYLVLTDDFKLSLFLLARGIDTINFNHLRNL